MRALIVDDDMASRLLLERMLESIASCDSVSNGKVAIEAFVRALEKDAPYSLVCMDIVMPEMDGLTVLKAIRAKEDAMALRPSQAAKVVMTTALRDLDSVTNSYRELCDGYLVKPINRDGLLRLLGELGLLADEHL